MMIFMFLYGILLTLGLFMVFADLLRLPTLGVVRAMLSTGKHDKKAVRNAETYLFSVAVQLSKYIYIDEYKKNRLCNMLKAADITMTPEAYTAYAIVKAGSILLGLIPCLLLIPLLSPVIVFLAVAVYFKEIKRADEKLRAKRDEIESDLPRFVATIEQELKNSRDVLSIIENFKKNSGKTFADELGVVTADMRSSSYEAALTRFEARLNSPQLSDVVRGLIGVLRGDDGTVYFQMLAHDFKALELQRLKGRAQKIPPKIRVYSFIMLLCFLITYLVIIATEIVQSLSGMF
jgi:flagellar protein FlaJ